MKQFWKHLWDLCFRGNQSNELWSVNRG